ncbi:TonB-dependent receptor plug [Pseudopedobacter saltans DSM 12145]|uniref:TonB-dependent receptor plug n=1 Tax=Pseudopedobacter saltans (strain ATCC 51119 / DSM 12145 / JCM 21818 / CCUG 39354 / LMG 10337 / NBRC 100064 / NCIMB 13643) TaxID=762903 RepID=F0SEH2_PSESL|nr:TonB-dependent receptor [Pseudopedobacter saltans]ADY50837.1 TonB-dependent receptor plug [Pseudopedobacter saltans DSM 12145]
MKRFYILSAFFLALNHSFAQQGPSGVAGAQNSIVGKISGVIIDSLTKTPVDYAAVSLSAVKQTKSINGALADDKGAFKLEKVVPGKYRLTISFIGYNTKIIEPITTTNSKPDLNLGTIILVPSNKILQEVVVEGQANIIENKIDKLVYNAEKDVAISGGTAVDVLRKVPLLSVDYEGNVSLRGSSNIKVLINGKPSGTMAGNIADALKAIPADQIKNVEVITSPSAKYDAEGTSGIINIITKKNNLEGISGSVNAGVGTRQNSGNINLNAKKGRLGLYANAGGYYSWPQTSIITFDRQNTNGDYNKQNGESTTERLATNGSIGADYDFNKYNSISSNLKVNWFQFSIDGFNDNKNSFGGIENAFKRMTDNKNKVISFDWNNDYSHKFKKEGQEITFAWQLSRSELNNDYNSFIDQRVRKEIGASDAINKESTFQLDYTHPFKGITLETGAKAIIRNIDNDSKVDSTDLSGGNRIPVPNRNFIYDYNQNVFAGYATLGFTVAKNYGIKGGARYEYTDIDGNDAGSGTFAPFKNNYGNFVPSIVISRTFKNFQTLKLSYNKRIQRPSVFYLNPFRNAADFYNQSEGNPRLSPEVSDNIELGYSRFIKTTVINASLYYRNTQNVIENVVKQIEIDGKTVSLTTFDNVGRNNSFGMNFFGSISPVKPLTLRGNFNVYTYDISLGQSSANLSGAENKTYFMYNAFLSGTYAFSKGFTFETFLITNSPRRTFQGKNPSFNMWNLGLKKELFDKKGSVGINVIDPFNNRKNFKSEITGDGFIQTNNFSIPFRSVGVNFSWRFGNLKVNQNNKRGVKNDDLKQGESSGGGMGGN